MLMIGVDVGGTNTDGVLMSSKRQVLAVAKVPTTADITDGIVTVLRELLYFPNARHSLQRVVIGTTHFTNAVVERQRLSPCACVRLCLPSGTSIPPMTDFPDDLRAVLGGHIYMAHGAYEVNGRLLSDLIPGEIAQIAEDIRDRGVRAVAICSVFSPINADMEERAADIIRQIIPGVSITQSHTIGRIGLLERENAAILNASLQELARHTVAAFEDAVREIGLDVPLYVSQNDGTIGSARFVEEYPALTFSSGPTNSIRGAGLLSGLSDAIVIDVGGTTTDIGMLVNGYPRVAQNEVYMGGVRTNFRMPDTLSFALGGGTRVHTTPFRVDTASVGHALLQEARVFGGNTLTLTDIAVASGWADIGDSAQAHDIPREVVTEAQAYIRTRINDGVDQIKTIAGELPAVVVGGGSVLIHQPIAGISEVIRPQYFHVANAIGAATAQVGAEVDKIYVLSAIDRHAALADARHEAITRAISAGADADSIEVVSLEEIPLAYLADETTRIIIKVIGDLA